MKLHFLSHFLPHFPHFPRIFPHFLKIPSTAFPPPPLLVDTYAIFWGGGCRSLLGAMLSPAQPASSGGCFPMPYGTHVLTPREAGYGQEGHRGTRKRQKTCRHGEVVVGRGTTRYPPPPMSIVPAFHVPPFRQQPEQAIGIHPVAHGRCVSRLGSCPRGAHPPWAHVMEPKRPNVGA